VDQSAPPRQHTTTIEYPSGQEDQAKTLAQYVPGAQVEKGDVSGLTLTLGLDGLTPHKTPTSSGTKHHHTHHHNKARGAVDAGCIN
jgi:hypothetical protein